MRYVSIPFAACAITLCACNGEEQEPVSEVEEPAEAEMEAHLTERTLGPLSYSFDDTELTVTDVSLSLPPDYEDSIFATKLIPAERAEQLGEEQCSYGESGRITACNAEQEVGLVLALLERPLEEYREAFAESSIPQEELEDAHLEGASGFSFTAEAEGSGTEYRFLPVDERTLLVARQFAAGQSAGAEAIADVIRSLARDVGDGV